MGTDTTGFTPHVPILAEAAPTGDGRTATVLVYGGIHDKGTSYPMPREVRVKVETDDEANRLGKALVMRVAQIAGEEV